MKIGIIISGYKFPCSIFDKKTECWHFSIIKYLNGAVTTGITFTTGHCRVIFWPDVGLFNVAPIIQASLYTNIPSPKRKCPDTVGIFKKWLSYSRGPLSQVATSYLYSRSYTVHTQATNTELTNSSSCVWMLLKLFFFECPNVLSSSCYSQVA